ncbi:cupredoxin family copper-binding protein [Candidatus Woesearchaeota archaeon]|nr:cupredoxin family copper-binding protein [Candidatus Woesearchaeota archaeon]
MKKYMILSIFLLLLGCGQSEQASQEADVTVLIKDYKFVPETVNVEQGQTIKWVNEDSALHTVESKNKEFASKELYQGDSYSFTATKPGTYEYICGLHPNMVGKVVVR